MNMKNSFPENFLWGSATSSHQVEGNNRNNNWWKWEQEGNTEPSGLACDHYNRFKEDFKLAKELGHNAHRFSLEWSRLEKEKGVWDEAEWAHYKEVASSLVDLGIEPIVSLNHFTIPLWLESEGGWTCEDSYHYFQRLAEKAIKELGSNVQWWIPITEPNIIAFLSYYQGIWPPCVQDFGVALGVYKNIIKAHVYAYQAMKTFASKNPGVKLPKIGTSKAITAFHPCHKFSIRDRICVHMRTIFHNYSFIDSALKGKVLVHGLAKEKLPINNAVDFIGLNYYFRQFIHYSNTSDHPFGEICSTEHHDTPGGITDMGWEIYPKGLYEVVRAFSKRYHLPLVISENGLATLDDTIRIRYIKEHLEYLLKAMNEGDPVFGYLHWSLMDNFEWAEGYAKRFGLIGVDYNTQERKIKPSARYYSKIIRSGKIED